MDRIRIIYYLFLAGIHNLCWIVQHTGALRGCSIYLGGVYMDEKRAVCDSTTALLHEIPENLPSDIRLLRIKNQLIRHVSRNSLMKLKNLTTLIIESSGLISIDEDAFDGLHSLEIINLRNNSLSFGKVRGLPRALFKDLRYLLELDLSDNPLGFLDNQFFDGLRRSALRKLSMANIKGNKPLVIAPYALEGLNNLEIIDLSECGLVKLSPVMESTFRSMHSLKEFYLVRNPLYCDCNLRWLKKWFIDKITTSPLKYAKVFEESDRKPTKTVPICENPIIAKKRALFPINQASDNSLQENDFMCPPEIKTNSTSKNAVLLSNVHMTCDIKSDPNCNLKWYKDNKTVTSDRPRITMETSGNIHMKGTLIISGIQSDDAGLWMCSCENKLGTVSAVFNATIKSGPYGAFGSSSRQTLIYTCVGVTALIVLLISVGLSIVCCCCNKINPGSMSVIEKTLQCARKDKLGNKTAECEEETGLMLSHDKGRSASTENSIIQPIVSNKIQVVSPKKSSPDSISPAALIKDTSNVSTKFYTLASNSSTMSPYKSSNTVYNTNHHLTELGGPLIQEAASVGGNRLLVSCDGPEPTVLLATGLPFSQASDNNIQLNKSSSEKSASHFENTALFSPPYANNTLTPNTKHSTLIENSLPSISSTYNKKLTNIPTQNILGSKIRTGLTKNSCPLHGMSTNVGIPGSEHISSSNAFKTPAALNNPMLSCHNTLTSKSEACPVHGHVNESRIPPTVESMKSGHNVSDLDADSSTSKMSIRPTKSLQNTRSLSISTLESTAKMSLRSNPINNIDSKMFNANSSTLPHRLRQGGQSDVMRYQPCPLHGSILNKSRSYSTLGIIKLDPNKHPSYISSNRRNLKARLVMSDSSDESDSESTSSTTTSASDSQNSSKLLRRKSCDYEETFDRLSRHSQISLHTSSVTSSSSRPGSVTNSTVKAYFYPVPPSKASSSNSNLSLNRSKCNVHSYNLATSHGKKLIGTPVQIGLVHSDEDSLKSITTSDSVSSDSQNSSTSEDKSNGRFVQTSRIGSNQQEYPSSVKLNLEDTLLNSTINLGDDITSSNPINLSNNQSTLKIRVKLKDPISSSTSADECFNSPGSKK